MINTIYALDVFGDYLISDNPFFMNSTTKIEPFILNIDDDDTPDIPGVCDSNIAQIIINKLISQGYDISSNCQVIFAKYNIMNPYHCDNHNIIYPQQEVKIIQTRECDLYGNIIPSIPPQHHLLYTDLTTYNGNNISQQFVPDGTLEPIKEILEGSINVDSNSTLYLNHIEGKDSTIQCQMESGKMIIPATINPVNYNDSFNDNSNKQQFSIDASFNLGPLKIKGSFGL